MKALVRVAVVAEMKVDINDMENAKNEMEDAIDALMIAEESDLQNGFTLRLASRKDLEEMAAAGALLPDPGVYVVEKKRKEKKG